MAAKAVATRRSIAADREAAKLIPRLAPLPAPAQPKPDDFSIRRLLRVRKQLSALDTLVEAELGRSDKADGRRLKELIEAQTRLSEQERIGANRPVPGSLRPVTPTASRSASHYPQPQPIAEPTPAPQSNDNALSSSPAPPSDPPPTDPN